MTCFASTRGADFTLLEGGVSSWQSTSGGPYQQIATVSFLEGAASGGSFALLPGVAPDLVLETPEVRLRINLTPGGILLAWESDRAFSIKGSDDLQTWRALEVEITRTGGSSTALIPASGRNQFFQLTSIP